ncbi:UDP-glucose 4-epimerase [Fusarium oxysporum f. sp. melonis 26406]|uniref:UDP-glucose 4-epimerase n=1 Tax=Fusarium oxysporum f. sp. melonis 26406 TaxID=1089452 RepID=W9YZJ6_FUSOX|nr:UDP-glucose 4-epimerase [Fusarium oxysporum f. sp. melonis 26406]
MGSYESTPGTMSPMTDTGFPFPSRPQSCLSLNSSSRPSTPSTEQDVLFSGPPSPAAPAAAPNEYVLVVGGLGYIGSHTTWELLKDGNNVVIIDNLSNAFIGVLDTLNHMADKRFNASSRRPDFHFYEADFRDDVKIQEILTLYSTSSGSKIKRVIHFAAYKSVSESIEKPLKYYDNNVGGLIRFCSTLSNFGIKYLVFSSSATVYGSLAGSGGRLVEESCTHTTTEWCDASGQARTTLSGCTGLTNPYGRTKWICEAILADLAVADPEWTIIALRYFNPIGCDDSGRLGEDPRVAPTNLMPVLLKVMLGEIDQLQVFGTDWGTRDGTAIRDFIHVSDLARGHVAALTVKDGQGFQTFNIGTGTGQTVYEVVDAIKAASGRDIPMAKVGRREGDVGACVADPRRAMIELGWKPQKTLLDSCRDLCRYLQAHGTNISA